MNKEYKKVIKSVGLNIELGGDVLDDSEGLGEEYEGWFEDGEGVLFEDGMKELKEYVLDEKGEVEKGSGEELWKEIEEKLMKIKEEVGEGGDWKLWGVEYDLSLGVEI